MKNSVIIMYIVGALAAILILMVIERVRPKEEAFVGQQNIGFCPRGWKSYYDSNGDMACCEGDVRGGVCEGVPRCSFSASSTLPSCNAVYAAYAAEKAKSVCPASMPNYFEGPTGAGCTAGALSEDRAAPAIAGSSPTCRMYDSDAMVTSSPKAAAAADSCQNQRRLDAVSCFGTDCRKSLYVSPASKTALVQVDFTDSTGVRHFTVTRDSYKDYLAATRPGWEKTIDLDKALNVTEVAKAVYVDRTQEA